MEHHLRLGPHREQLVATSEFSHGKQASSSYLQYPHSNWTTSGRGLLAPEVDKRPLLSRQLALSWVLILVIAPLLVALLAWLLVLILRRASQTRLLLARDTPAHEILAQSSSLWSISSSSSRSSCSQLRLNNNNNNKNDSGDTLSEGQARRWKLSHSSNLHQQEARKSLKTVQRLIERTNLYLLTLTYQQILACVVAFSLAIVNIMRMRNLFYCNLVIFILVTSKLLNLLTLVTFSISKLFLLFRLRPVRSSGYGKSVSSVMLAGKSNTNVGGEEREDEELEEEEVDGEEYEDESDAEAKLSSENHRGTTSSSTNSSETSISISGQDEASACSQMGAESELIKQSGGQKSRGRTRRRRSKRRSRRRRMMRRRQNECCGSSAEGELTNNATIKRLITKGQTSSKQPSSTFHMWSTSACKRAAGGGAELRPPPVAAAPMATGGHQQQMLANTIKPPHDVTRQAKPALCRLFSLMLLAGGLALVCLYLRLMPPPSSSPVTPRTPFTVPFTTTSQNNINNNNNNNNSTTAARAQQPPTTTSLPQPAIATATTGEPARPNYQGWAARLQQSPAWRQLVDQYNLATFLQVLLDTQLQTSHFSCSIIAGNYSPSSRLSMATAYGALVALVFLVSLLTGQLGGRQLRKFEASFLDTCHSQLHHQAWQHSPFSSFSSNGRGGGCTIPQAVPSAAGKTDSNRKRYSELLKQNIRHHHRSALEIHQQQQQLRHPSKNAPLLRGSSSMSSLLAGGPPARAFSKPPPMYASASARHQLQHPAACFGGQPSQVSQHQLAWIPLGGAATVASLSNMKGGWSPNVLPGQASGSSSAGRIYRQRRQQHRQTTTAADQQPLGAIDERQTVGHPVEYASSSSRLACQQANEQHERRLRALRLELEVAGCNRISHSEIRADLRLAQALILFGQLLDQAPVLLLLTLACLLPEGTLEANWNSAHDNAFVWLTLVEALLFPLLLYLLDERLSLALKRSLRCSASSSQAGLDKTSGLASLAELGACSGYQQSRVDHLLLAPPPKHPCDLQMLARNPLYQQSPVSSKAARTCHTGPPYPVPSFGTYADDGSHDTLRANFALVGKTTAHTQELLPAELLTQAGLLAHQRQRRQVRRRRPKSALLNVTRRILRLGRTKAHQRAGASRRAGPGSGYALEAGGAPGNQSTSSSSAAGGAETNQRGSTSGRLSPTSSLSTLIRKFNHDNYTSVCQQYQQRKAQVAREQLVELAATTTGASTINEGCLIEGLDMPSSGSGGGGSMMQQSHNGKQFANTCEDHQNILCRKGGLYYNYCLDSEPPAASELGARMNPMLAAGGLQPFVVDAVVGGSMSSLLEDKLKSEQLNQLPFNEPQLATTRAEQLAPREQQVNQLREKKRDEANNEKSQKQPSTAIKTSVETTRKESNKRTKATKKNKPSAGGETASKVASKGAQTTTSNNNNHTIISNLTSVQELLDKMNGMMGCNGQQQLPENKANPGSSNEHQPQHILSQGSQSKPAMDTCVSAGQTNSSRQQSDGQPERPQAADALEYMSLDYTSLRSLDDALSLVSVSSEFEYHNINRDELRMAAAAASAAPPQPHQQPQQQTSAHLEKSCSQESALTGHDKPSKSTTIDTLAAPSQEEACNLLLLSATSSSLSSASSVGASSNGDTNKRLNNLRFPSFLPSQAQVTASASAQVTNGKPVSEVSKGLLLMSERNRAPRASARGSSTSTNSTNSSSQQAANFQKRANSSSSLLNLTVAKFGMAAALTANGVDSSGAVEAGKQLARQQLPHRFAGSSNTIVKQRGAGSSRPQMLVELADNNNNNKPESSLKAAESGHVRARIRKMEQQSVPNLNSSQQHSSSQQLGSPSSNSKSRLPTLQAANLPTTPTVTSKLPVPITGHLQLQQQRSSQPPISSTSTSTSTSSSSSSSSSPSSSSSTTDINHSPAKRTTRQLRAGSSSSSTRKHR